MPSLTKMSSTKTPLTDFEELAVYACRQHPMLTDGVTVGRILYLIYRDYRDRFSEIYALFAR